MYLSKIRNGFSSIRFCPIPIIALVAIALLAASCSTRRAAFSAGDAAPSILVPVNRAGIIDGRGRFREIFRAVLAARSPQSGKGKPFDDTTTLWRLSGEPPATGKPVVLGRPNPDYCIVIVPGLLAECVSQVSTVFGDARKRLQTLGYNLYYLQTAGRRSSRYNAVLIRNEVMKMVGGKKIIFVTHSKGAVDTLEALAQYPDLAQRTAAVISFSGAIDGSPLAAAFPDFLQNLLDQFPLSSCGPGTEAEAVGSLRRSVRISWLSTHILPKGVRYYSLAAFTTRDNTSRILRPFYDILARTDPLNDGMVISSDAIIPGSVLLGYPNADHYAVAMPFNGDKYRMLAALIDKNDYPRAELLEAALRYAEEELAGANRSQAGKSITLPAQ
ncbi:MAG: lipase family alpha/beta hydrolase [Syntrophobacteraceae bacterium]